MRNAIKVYHVVQELRTFSLTGNRRTDGRTHIVIIVQTQGSCNILIVIAILIYWPVYIRHAYCAKEMITIRIPRMHSVFIEFTQQFCNISA